MVHGKEGLRLEAYKFALYIAVPIFASVVFSYPEVQRVCVDYFQFLKYPANPTTNLKKEFEEFQKTRDLQIRQRNEYAEQLHKLHASASRSRLEKEHATMNGERKSGWLGGIGGWFGFRKKNKEKEQENNRSVERDK